MGDALDSAWTKLKRANLHAGIAKREAGRFIQKHPSPPLRGEVKAEPHSIEIGSTVDIDLVFGDGPSMPDLPPSFSARFGDAIQNYRAALDHVAWQLVKHGKTPNPPKEHLVQFPICFSERTFTSELADRLPGVDTRPGGPCEFIKRRHRYKRKKARNETLLRLKRLSNDDKHRSLHAMVTAVGHAKHDITFTDCRHTAFTNPPEPPRIQPSAVVAHMTVILIGPNPEVNVEPNLSAYVALEGWANAIDTLGEIRREVTEILNAPEILRAVG